MNNDHEDMSTRLLAEMTARIFCLSLATIVMLCLFWAPPVRLYQPEPSDNNTKANLTIKDNTLAFELVLAEHKKAVDEIKLRIEREDDWFHHKFVLLGMLVLGFVAYIFFQSYNREDENMTMEELQKRLLSSSATCSMLALACVISLAIDMHIRSHISTAAQLGIWIKEYVETPILGKYNSGDFKGWETFLHNPCKKEHETECRPSLSGMHGDDIYRFAWPHLHILTWLLYVIYMLVLFNVWNAGKEQRRISFVGFVLVHFSLCGFAWIAHYFPKGFQSQTWPFYDKFASGSWQPLSYVGLCLVLVAVNGLYLWATHQENRVLLDPP